MTDTQQTTAERRGLGRIVRWISVPPRPFRGALVIALGIPAFVGILGKSQQISVHPKKPGLDLWPGLLASDLALQLGLAALGLAIFTASGRHRRIGLGLAQLPGLFGLIVAVFAHGYYASTGQVLDYELFAFALSRWREVLGVVTAEAPAWMNALAVVMPIALLVLPWWWVRRRGALPGGGGDARFGIGTAASTMLLSLIAAASMHVAQYPKVEGYRHGFVRSSIVHLVWGATKQFSKGRAGRGKAEVPRAAGATALKHRGGARPNVVVVVLESTRATATTPYHRALKSTPFLDELSKESLLVRRAYAVVPHTSKALVSILCGLEPRSTVDVVEATKGGMPGKCLAKLLGEAGYDTMYFQAPTSNFENREVLTRNMGFARFVSGERLPHKGLTRVNYFGYEDDIVLPSSQRFIDRQKRSGKPFFAAYLTNVGHSPYGVPKGFERQQLSKSKMRNKYYNAVLYSDGFLKRLLDQYKAAGLYENTIFVVLGDHGEGMREHGGRGHDTILYDEGVTVPLVVRLPGGKGARTVPGPISQLSIVPTVLDAAGFDVVAGRYEGVSFLREDSESVVYISCFRARTCAAMVKGDRKLIYYYGDRSAELFDLRRDPKERRDLAGRERGLVGKWTRELLDWTAAVELTHAGADRAALDAYVDDEPPTDIAHPGMARFGPFFEFIGFKTKNGALRRTGSNLTTFYFHVLAPIPESYQLRVRVSAPGGSSERILDGVAVRGLYPLQRWKPGEFVADARAYKLRGWDRPDAQFCIELLDQHGLAIPAVGPGGRTEACYPVGTMSVPPDRKRKRKRK